MNTTAIADTFLPTRFPKRTKSVRLHIEFENEPNRMTAEEFWEFCQENRKIHAELTKEGDLIIMPPTGWETSDRNAEITTQLRIWAKKKTRRDCRFKRRICFAERRNSFARFFVGFEIAFGNITERRVEKISSALS